MLDVENDKISALEYVPEDEQSVLNNELSHNVKSKKSNASEYIISEDENVLDNELLHQENSGSEYVPSEDEQNALDELQEKRQSILNSTKTSTSTLDASQINDGAAICNDEIMSVETSNLKSGKRNYCVFCSKLQTQLARHLEMVHRNEPEVKKFAILPKNNPERRKIIDTLRRNGNFKYNTNSDVNDGQLIVCRRPNEKYQARYRFHCLWKM